MPSSNNWAADGTPFERPNLVERGNLLRVVLRDHLISVGSLGASEQMPDFIERCPDPINCDYCYGGVRAVGRVRNHRGTYNNGCMRCIAHHFDAWRERSHQCRDCDLVFVGQIPTWCHSGYTRIQGVQRDITYPLCQSCSLSYLACPDEDCGLYYNTRNGQPCHAPTLRCSYCNVRATDENPFHDLMVINRYSASEPDTMHNLCTECVTNRITTCVDCGQRGWRREMNTITSTTGEHVCTHCAQTDRWLHCTRHGTVARIGGDTSALCCNPLAQIHSYSYRPALNFRGDGPMFYGAEIEICTRDVERSANVAGTGFQGIVYLKEDGSVSSGFEMVTHPMSYDYWMQSFPWDNFAALRESGAYEHSSCGIHVHAARAGFSGAAHEHRWLSFFDRNQQMIEKVARRSNSSYARFNQLTSREKKMIATKEVRPGEWRFQRYSAVNCNNEHTYEVRIFATSINADVVKGSIGFVAATIEYTRQLKARDVMKSAGMDWSAFRMWVESRPEFAPLMSEIIRVGA